MKILVLEESRLARRFINDELVPTGYEIHEAGTTEEALEILTSVPDIDLLTLRVVLKGMDGFQFLEHLQTEEVRSKLRKYNNHKVPAMFVTSNDTDKDRLRGFQVGAAEFIQKPWPPGELLSHVNRVLGRSTELAGMSVLVVDDSHTARKFIRNSLKSLGVHIHEADDGDTAVEFLSNPDNTVDLVITDLNMVRMHGDELIVKIRGELGFSDLPVIFLSGNDDKDMILALFKMGATDYLKKPFLKEELVSRMRAYLTRIQTQNKLKDSVAHLRDLNLVKDQFLAACSHDLRSPLVGILDYSGLLEEGDSLSESQQEMVLGIQRSGGYLLQLINNLLDIGKMASGRTEFRQDEVDLFKVLEDSARSMVHVAEPKGIKLETMNSADDARIRGDRGALMRICNNLLSNAIKFTGNGGYVTASVRDGRQGELILAVTDTGIGIKSEDIPDLFKRYTKISKSGTSGEKGTGLGLSITKDFVDSLGGTVAVESTEGEGTTFRVLFPTLEQFSEAPVPDKALVEEPMIELCMPGEEIEAVAAQEDDGRYVLLVEHEAVNREKGSAILHKMGFEVETANNGAEALNMYRDSCRTRRYDLILMDLEMPAINGLDATRKLRKFEQTLPDDHEAHHKPVVVLAMTTNSGDVSLGECLSAGMNDFLTKPFVVSQIAEAMERWVTASV